MQMAVGSCLYHAVDDGRDPRGLGDIGDPC